MTWRPTTDFEEEIVNLQPDHDFIFGVLSEPEPQPFYPRPKSHIEYAATKRRQSKKQQEEYESTGKFNNRLHVISQVQRIAGTKPLGEQPTDNDWDDDKDVEKEVVAMMRHFGMGPSVEEPLNEKVTIATYPVANGLNVMQNGRKKVPLLFDNNLFKLKPKVSPEISSSSSASASGGENQFNPTKTDNINLNKLEEHISISSPSSSSTDSNTNSFYTSDNLNNSILSNESLGDYNKAEEYRHALLLQAERMLQYDKLQEINLDDENMFPSLSEGQDSFRTAYNGNATINSDLNDSFLSSQSSDFKTSGAWYRHPFSKSNTASLNNSISDSSSSSKSSTSFLQSFIKPEEDCVDESHISKKSLNSTTSSSSLSPILPPSYANVSKKSVNTTSSATRTSTGNVLRKSTIAQSPPTPPQLRFYTAREVYAMRHKRDPLQ